MALGFVALTPVTVGAVVSTSTDAVFTVPVSNALFVPTRRQ